MVKRETAPALDAFVDTALQSAEQAFGKERCYVAADHEARQLVMPIRPLSLQWLIESNGWPVGRFTQSGGAFGSHKSCFIFQLIAWFLEAQGFCCLIDTENKTSDSLLRSMIPPEYFDPQSPLKKRFLVLNATSVEEWQRMITNYFNNLQEFSKKTRRKPDFASFLAVDAMLGVDSESGLEHIKTEGQAMGKTFSEAPLLISQFTKGFTGNLIGWPITLHFSHHEKANMGTVGTHRPGGSSVDYHASLDIKFKKGGTHVLGTEHSIERPKLDGLQGRPVTMTVRKSSMGSDGNQMTVLFYWKYIENRQISWWDWDGTTSMVLYQNQAAIRDIAKIEKAKVAARGDELGGDYYWSDELGVTEADKMPAHLFGAHVERHELRQAIANALRIQQHKVFGDV